MEATLQQTTTTAGGGADLTRNIVKRKRTKRQRLQSAIPFTITSTHCNPNNDDHDRIRGFNYSPASSSDFPAGSTTTEDEDTAECLILLSRGRPLPANDGGFAAGKFNSKRFIQTSENYDNGTSGIYVYECKTCSRTFPSFQALGGHRTSHTKPKVYEEKRKLPPYAVVSDEDIEFPWRKNNSSSSSSSLSLQLITRKPATKLHECAICRAEFNSGQALGGHMRRHRVVAAAAAASTSMNATTALSLVPYRPPVPIDDQGNLKSKNDGSLGLDLDLNLPAPPDAAAAGCNYQDQHRNLGFTFSTAADATQRKKPPPAVRLSTTPTLVDCHY